METAFNIHRHGTIHNTHDRIYTTRLLRCQYPSKRVGIYSYAITNHHGPRERSGNRKQIAFVRGIVPSRRIYSGGLISRWRGPLKLRCITRVTTQHLNVPESNRETWRARQKGNRMRERECEKGRWTRQRGREGQGGTERADIGQCAVG